MQHYPQLLPIKDANGQNALSHCATFQQNSPEQLATAQLLLRSGADFSSISPSAQYVLREALIQHLGSLHEIIRETVLSNQHQSPQQDEIVRIVDQCLGVTDLSEAAKSRQLPAAPILPLERMQSQPSPPAATACAFLPQITLSHSKQ